MEAAASGESLAGVAGGGKRYPAAAKVEMNAADESGAARGRRRLPTSARVCVGSAAAVTCWANYWR